MAPTDVRSSRPPVAPTDDCDALDRLLGPGDVLYIRGGETRLFEIGVTGGSFGHVVLATGQPRRIEADSDEGYRLSVVFPGTAEYIWSVPTVESTSAEEGLHQTELLLVVDQARRILVIGEQPDPEELITVDPVAVEIWQSPQELKALLRQDVLDSVIAEMKAHEANWSFRTAARAWLKSALIKEGTKQDPAVLLREVQDCWLAAPICTSIVITFWQRYLCTLAGGMLAGQSPLDLVLRWMPVKADRGLPDELLDVMRLIGWHCIQQLPRTVLRRSSEVPAPVLLCSMGKVCGLRHEKSCGPNKSSLLL